MLLRGLAEVGPPGRWLVWGPGSMAALWPAAGHVPTDVDPAAWFGQRSALRVPRADRAFHPHQTRPLHGIPAASCILDLIQLQHPSIPIRAAKELRLRATVRAAEALFTISSSVRESLISDFGVDPATVAVLPMPVDEEAAARRAARRSSAAQGRYLLSVGRFDRHKNLPRLIEAFGRSRFARTGGTLRLVGGTKQELLALGVGHVPDGVHVLGRLAAADLDDVVAGAAVLVQASVVEGYGLPVAEALLGGLPVTSSPIPAAAEFGPTGLPVFDPHSVPSMTNAIDETVDLVESDRYWTRVDRAAWVSARPTTRDLAEAVVAGLAPVGRRE